MSEVQLTIEDFRICGWQDAVARVHKDRHSDFHTCFSEAAQQAQAAGDIPKSKCLMLLACISSMALVPEKFNEPFKPLATGEDGRRTMVPEDLQEADVIFLAQILNELDNYWLKARVADIVWLLARPKDVRVALQAIDAYREAPLDKTNMVRESKLHWTRAIYLCINLRSRAGDRLVHMEQTLFEAFEVASHTDGFLAIWLADLLGLIRSQRAIEIAQKLEAIAVQAEAEGEYSKAYDFFGKAVAWYGQAKEEELAVKSAIKEAEMLAQQGYARISGENISHMSSVHFFEKAIQLYRAIPKAYRVIYGIDDRISILHKQLATSGRLTLDELSPVRSELNIAKLIEEARARVENKRQVDALYAFANIHAFIDKKVLRQQTLDLMLRNPLSSLFPSVVFGADGRVIAKSGGLDIRDPNAKSNEKAIYASMIENYLYTIGVVTEACIIPALQVLQLEHRFTEADFIAVCAGAPIIPRGSEVLFGRALAAGFENDFMLTIHLLAPQVENLVRFHLKFHGGKTTTLDAAGIEMENGLSTLVDQPQMAEAFGENLTFEIDALFCDAHGPNLRNQIAHGLLTHNSFNSLPIIYAWWFWLRIIYNSFINATWGDNRRSEEEAPIQ